jgi:general secretion pathway protein G
MPLAQTMPSGSPGAGPSGGAPRAGRRAGDPCARPRGFTLIELMVSLLVLAILAVMVDHISEIMATRKREQHLYEDLRMLRGAIDAYKHAYDAGRIAPVEGASGYPNNLQVLVDGVEDALDPNHAKIRFLEQIPADPMQRDGAMAPADTWAPRAYASDPNDPRPGADVYDVHSRSARPGLNGAPYSAW